LTGVRCGSGWKKHANEGNGQPSAGTSRRAQSDLRKFVIDLQ